MELHDQLVDLLTDEEKISSLRDRLKPQAFSNVIWATITILLKSPLKALSQEIEDALNQVAEAFTNLPISLEHYSRCQFYDLDDSAFRSHVAPKLITRLQSNSSICAVAFRCLIGTRNQSTSAFMRSWVKEYGLEHPLTQQLVNVAPFIARLISLTYAILYIKHIQEITNSDGSYIVPHSEEIDYEIRKREDPQIEEAWLSLQNNFAENQLQKVAIVDTFKWIPEVLTQIVQQMPDWSQQRFIQHAFDWEFLTAVLVPVLEVKVESDEIKRFISSLCEQVTFAFLHGRERVYIEYKADQEKGRYSGVYIHLCQAQSQLLDKVIRPNYTNILVQVENLLCALRNSKLMDCILLEYVIDTLKYDFADLDENHGSLKTQIAFAIGDYIFEFRNQPDSDLKILGKINDVWEKLIKLLSQESRVTESVAFTDQSLVRFFVRFQEVIFSHWWLRRKLYCVAKSVRFKKFRRIIFEAIVQCQALLPSGRNDESESLVQVLAELWDSDCTWIIRGRLRRQDLRTLLGHLQEIDAVGARSLADQVASFLSNPTS